MEKECIRLVIIIIVVIIIIAIACCIFIHLFKYGYINSAYGWEYIGMQQVIIIIIIITMRVIDI